MEIYLVTNKVNDKLYVGKTSRNVILRQIEHESKAKLKLNDNHFHNALAKHGLKNFIWKTLRWNIETAEELPFGKTLYPTL